MIPSGITQAQIVETIDKVMGSLANKFKFGIHQRDDLMQQGRLIAWRAILEKYDGKRPLENFLRVHLRNRIINFKRDNTRHEDPAYLEGEPLGERCVERESYNNEIGARIDRELPPEYRGDYLQMRDGVNLPKHRKDKLIEVLRLILEEYEKD